MGEEWGAAAPLPRPRWVGSFTLLDRTTRIPEPMSLRIHFLGAAREVTGSMFLLETDGGNLLVDCGMFQGHRDEARERNRELPRVAVHADAMVLTHAHIDHSGSVPTLVKRGFTGRIHATPATSDVAALMLRDSARIQAADAEYLNRRFGEDPGWVPIEPVYDEDDVDAAIARFNPEPYRRVFEPLPGMRAWLLDAGHILGSSSLVLDVEDAGTKRRFVFSGDLGRAGLPILKDPELPPTPIDYAILESTYGNRIHGDVARMHEELERVVKQTVERRGRLVIPAFALGRTQEILLVLNQLRQAGRLPPIPVFVDSPLATGVTEVYRRHPECFDRDAESFAATVGAIFDFPELRFVATREDSIALNDYPDPCIILSASGMAEAGRVLHHLRHAIGDPRNTIAIVGFMAQHTLGRRLAEGRQRVRILGVEQDVQAQVEVLDVFSAHAGRDGLLRWAQACGPVRSFFLVHGEPEQQEPLRATLAVDNPVVVPERGAVITLD